jgi:A/G-specific adenine glycosylase
MDDFLGAVYKWYIKNKRDLPWRQETDPYKIWISEIILQQTRIDQGMSYYQRLHKISLLFVNLRGQKRMKFLSSGRGLDIIPVHEICIPQRAASAWNIKACFLKPIRKSSG